MLPTLLTVCEAAAAMKISESAVRSLCNKKLLSTTHVGAGRGRGTVRIYESSVLAYMERNTVSAVSPSPAAKNRRVQSGVGFKFLESLGYEWPGARRVSSAASSDLNGRSVG